MIARGHVAIACNVGKALNRAAHRQPWVLMGIEFVVGFVACYIQIALARMERDHLARQVYIMRQDSINNTRGGRNHFADVGKMATKQSKVLTEEQ